MKKFTMFAAGLVLAGAGVSAQAQDLYLCGPFNNFAPEGNTEWKLIQDDDEDSMFRRLVEIPAGQFQVNFQYMQGTLIPAKDDGEGSDANVVVLEDDTFFSGKFATTGLSNVCWVCDGWQGGEVEITVDFSNEEVIFSAESQPLDAWYIRGAFNGYDPAGNVEWALEAQTNSEENGLYMGVFNVPAGQFSFNLMNQYGIIYVPYDNTEYIGITQPVIFEDNVFTGSLDYAYDETEESCYWTYDAWEGGRIAVTVNLENGTITIEALEPELVLSPYLVGEFNEFGEGGVENWTLDLFDEDQMIYRGTFYIPEGQLKFNIGYGFGNFVPGEYVDGEIVPAAENMTVLTAEDEGFFSSPIATSELLNTYWENADWAGGDIQFTLDLLNNELILSVEEGPFDGFYLIGAFNNYTPSNDWVLLPTDNTEENGVYVAEVEIPEDQFSFNIMNAIGMYFVPEDPETSEGATVEVEFTDDVYTGNAINAFFGEETCYWTVPGWEGGKVQISLDSNTTELTITVLEYSGVSKVVAAEGNEVIYNLNGMRVDGQKALKGIFIVNGKKVVKM